MDPRSTFWWYRQDGAFAAAPTVLEIADCSSDPTFPFEIRGVNLLEGENGDMGLCLNLADSLQLYLRLSLRYGQNNGTPNLKGGSAL